MDKEPDKRVAEDITSNTKNAVLGTALAKPNEAAGLRGKAKKLFTRYKEEMAWVQIARKDIEIEESLARDTKKIIKANIYKAASLKRILNLIETRIVSSIGYTAKLIARAFDKEPFKVSFLLNMDIVWNVKGIPLKARQAKLIGDVLDEIYKDNHDKAINISVAAIDGFVRREMDGDAEGVLKYSPDIVKKQVIFRTITDTGSLKDIKDLKKDEIIPYIHILERAVWKYFSDELKDASGANITFYQKIDSPQSLENLENACRVRVENKDTGKVYNRRLVLEGLGFESKEGE